MGTTVIRNNPQAMATLQQNCMEHILLMAQEQVELEFSEENQQLTAMQQQTQPLMQQAQGNPELTQQLQQSPEMQQVFQFETNLRMRAESRKAQLISEFTDDYAKA